MEMLRFLVLVASLTSLAVHIIVDAVGCKCKSKHCQEDFCGSDFGRLGNGVIGVTYLLMAKSQKGRNFHFYSIDMSLRKEYDIHQSSSYTTVVEVRVESWLGAGDYSFRTYEPYKVKMLEIYKGKKFFQNGVRKDTLFAPGVMHFCGAVKVNVGESYLVEGYIRQRTMYAYVCRSVKNMKDVTDVAILAMEKYDCSCKLYKEYSWDMVGPMPESKDPNKCVTPAEGSCLFTNGACVRNPKLNNTCHWETVKPCL